MLEDLSFGLGSSDPLNRVVVGDTLFFPARCTIVNSELWALDIGVPKPSDTIFFVIPLSNGKAVIFSL